MAKSATEKKTGTARKSAGATKSKSASASAAKSGTTTPPNRRKAGTKGAAPVRPWIDHYPEGISWDTPIDDTTPVHEKVLAACDTHADRTALDFFGATTSFADMGRDIRAFAGALQSEFGLKKGDRVALLLPNTPFYAIAYYGVLLAGGTVVNCNPLYTVNEIAHITENASADLMVTLDLKQVFEKAERLCADDKVNQLIVAHFPDALPGVKKVLYSLVKRGDLSDWKTSAIADKCTAFAGLVAMRHEPKPVKINAKKDVAVQQYTGGTTGEPKGAMLSHANIAANVSQIEAWGCGLFEPPSQIVAVLPFFHIFAMTVCLNVPLSGGASVVMLPRFQLKDLLKLLTRTSANVLPAVPTLIHAVASSENTQPRQLASLEVLISGGAPLPGETREKFSRLSDALLAEGYGLTECAPVVCCAALRVPSKPMSIGLPVPGTDIRFADVDNPDTPVPQGERGELQVKGPQVMLGYYNDKQSTVDSFVEGWFRTGDVGYMDDEGYVFLVDRIKDLIIASGFNVYPRTIEEALYEHEDVDECNVIGVDDDYRGEAPVAFVKLRNGATTTAEDLETFLAQHVSKIEIPREIIFRKELPKTLVGKLSKNDLRAEYAKMKETEQ